MIAQGNCVASNAYSGKLINFTVNENLRQAEETLIDILYCGHNHIKAARKLPKA